MSTYVNVFLIGNVALTPVTTSTLLHAVTSSQPFKQNRGSPTSVVDSNTCCMSNVHEWFMNVPHFLPQAMVSAPNIGCNGGVRSAIHKTTLCISRLPSRKLLWYHSFLGFLHEMYECRGRMTISTMCPKQNLQPRKGKLSGAGMQPVSYRFFQVLC